MQQGINKLSFFLVAFILIILAVIPIFYTIQSGFDSTNGFYQNSQNTKETAK